MSLSHGAEISALEGYTPLRYPSLPVTVRSIGLKPRESEKEPKRHPEVGRLDNTIDP